MPVGNRVEREMPGKTAATSNDPKPHAQKRVHGGPEAVATVLVIDDSVEQGELIRLTLERMNLRVFHATHGHQALDVLHAVHPDLVLLDVALPDMSGWDVLETMREQQRGSGGPVILVVTAYHDPANRLMGKLQGVRDYLLKPLTSGQVERAVDQALKLPPNE
ncbi:MAG TPA: response regulator [Aggregatilineaceae bacterium]|nr:response regulator [Aggregatilineaceae bacterium]